MGHSGYCECTRLGFRTDYCTNCGLLFKPKASGKMSVEVRGDGSVLIDGVTFFTNGELCCVDSAVRRSVLSDLCQTLLDQRTEVKDLEQTIDDLSVAIHAVSNLLDGVPNHPRPKTGPADAFRKAQRGIPSCSFDMNLGSHDHITHLCRIALLALRRDVDLFHKQIYAFALKHSIGSYAPDLKRTEELIAKWAWGVKP